MQILMHGTICRTEYSCGHWAGCPCSGPNAAFLLPSLFWHADKEQQGKEQGGESKVSLWQKFTPNFMAQGRGKWKSFTMCCKLVMLVFCCLVELKPTSDSLYYSGICLCILVQLLLDYDDFHGSAYYLSIVWIDCWLCSNMLGSRWVTILQTCSNKQWKLREYSFPSTK